jgi:hypothetical protein
VGPSDQPEKPLVEPAPDRWVERLLVVGVCLLVGWFYLWTVRSTGDDWKYGKEQRDYYNLLIDGYLEGQLHMKVEVPEELLRLKDPYDPNQRPPGLGLHDASFYHGKYYVYFGVAPVVTLMLPFRLMTGNDLPQPVAALVFVYLGFLAAVGIWLSIRRRYFPNTSTAVVVLCILVLGLAATGPVLLRRPHMWELPIGAGAAFAMFMLGCIWRSVHSERRRVVWFAGAGLSLGLAIGSRPTYLLASVGLAVPLAWWWCSERRVPWRAALGAALPLALIGSAMAWHNYARFGDPLQFGQAYQFSLDYESKVAHFRPGYVGFNAWRYFWSPAQWTPYFPFIAPADLPPKPAGFGGHDDVYGILRNLPIAWLALLAPLAASRRSPKDREMLLSWLGSTALVFAAMAAILLFFFGSLTRYQSDFTPPLMLLATVGVLAVERELGRCRWWALRAAGRGVWGAVAIGSVGFGVLLSLQLDGLLGERNPALARSMAKTLNAFPATVERVLGRSFGAVEMTVRFRPHNAGQQVVLAVGAAPRISHLLVHYLEDQRVEFSFVQGSAPPIRTRAMRIDFARAHQVRLTIGSLFPPATHPFFAGRTPAEINAWTRLVRLEVDGETVLREYRRFDGATPQVSVGREVTLAGTSPFDGEIGAVRRVAAAGSGSAAATGSGFARLFVTFPERPSTPREPLFSVGDAARGGVVSVHFQDDTGQVSLGVSKGGERTEAAEPIAAKPGRVHEITVQWTPGSDAGRRKLEARLDGVIVLAREVPWPEQGDTAIVAGRNLSQEPGCAPEFTGTIHRLQRSARGGDPLLTSGETLKLRVQFPTDQAGQREPLVVTGQNGGGDLLMIEYVGNTGVRFSLDHWGSPLRQSEVVKLDLRVPHEIELTLGSLAAPADSSLAWHVKRGPVDVVVDGAKVWAEQAEFFTAEAAEVAIGRNIIGGTGCGPQFTGEVLAAERLARE